MEFKIPVEFDNLFQLINKLTGSKDILDKLRLYLNDPQRYIESDYRDYCSFDEDELEELVDDEDFRKRTFPSDVVTGLLTVERFMWRVDWRESLQGIEYAIDSLLERKGLSGLNRRWGENRKMGIKSYEYLNAIGCQLDDEGLKLAFIDDGSDSFPLIIVHKNEFEEISDLAESLGVDIKTKFA